MQRVHLNKQPLQHHAIQQSAHSRDLTTAFGGVGFFGNGGAEAVGIQAYLGNEPLRSASAFIGRASPGLPIANQGLRPVSHTRLSCHPQLQQRLKLADIQLSQEQTICGIRWRLGAMGAQQLVERSAVAFGTTLHPRQRTLAGQDRKNSHQQHLTLLEVNLPAHPVVRKGLDKTDKICCGARVLMRGCQSDNASSAAMTVQMQDDVKIDATHF